MDSHFLQNTFSLMLYTMKSKITKEVATILFYGIYAQLLTEVTLKMFWVLTLDFLYNFSMFYIILFCSLIYSLYAGSSHALRSTNAQ